MSFDFLKPIVFSEFYFFGLFCDSYPLSFSQWITSIVYFGSWIRDFVAGRVFSSEMNNWICSLGSVAKWLNGYFKLLNQGVKCLFFLLVRIIGFQFVKYTTLKLKQCNPKVQSCYNWSCQEIIGLMHEGVCIHLPIVKNRFSKFSLVQLTCLFQSDIYHTFRCICEV